MSAVVQFPHEVRGNIEILAGGPTEGAIAFPLDPPVPEEASSQNVIPPTPIATSSQLPITDPASVSAKGKAKGQAAKHARVAERKLHRPTLQLHIST